MIQFTKLINDKGLMTKTAQRNSESGAFEKASDVQMYSGRFETIKCAWADLGTVLEATGFNEALILGTNVQKVEQGRIVCLGDPSLNPEKGVFARGKEHFDLPKENTLLYLDFDHIPTELAGSGDVESSVEAVMHDLFKVYPAFALLDFWIRPSSGSYVYDILNLDPQDPNSTGSLVKGLTGMHAYFRKPHGVSAEQIKQYLQVVGDLSLTEDSFQINGGEAANLKPLYKVDLSSFVPSKPIFAAGLYCTPESGFEQRNREALYWQAESSSGDFSFARISSEFKAAIAGFADKGSSFVEAGRLNRMNMANAFSTKYCVDNIRKERSAAKAKSTGMPLKAVRKQVDLMLAGEFPASADVRLDDGTWVRGWKICLYGSDYNGKTCADPFEPDYGGGRNKGKIYAGGSPGTYGSGSASASIFSFAHGENLYRIRLDFQSIQEILGMDEGLGVIDSAGNRVGTGMTKNELEDTLGSDWINILRDLSDSERNQVFDWLKKRGWFEGKGAAKVAFADAMTEQAKKSTMQGGAGGIAGNNLQTELEELNKYYAELELGDSGEVTILRSVPNEGSGATERYGHQKIKSFAQVNNKKVTVWSEGKAKAVSVGEKWLEWPKRRKYCQLVYRPDIASREIPVKVRGKDGFAFNLFEGLAVRADGCGPRPCGADSGCLSCFFDGMRPEGVLAEQEQVVSALHSQPMALATGQKYCICKFHLAPEVAGATRGGITTWLRHLYECVCSEIGEDALWVAEWFLNIIANPGGEHMGTVMAVYGSGFGTGKSAVAEPIKQILGARNNCFTTADTDLIVGRFNSAIEGRLLIHAEEALWREGKNISSKFKHLVMGETVQIERKGLENYNIDNHARICISSNELKAVPVVPGERRVAAFKIQEHRRGDRNWFGRFLCGRGEKPHDYQHWVDEAQKWNFRANLHVVPDTDGLREQKLLGMKDHPEMAAFEWSLESEYFWDAEGFPLEIPSHEMKLDFMEQGFARPSDWRSFIAKFWSTLTALGIKRIEGKSVRIPNTKVVCKYSSLDCTLGNAKKAWEGLLSANTNKGGG